MKKVIQYFLLLVFALVCDLTYGQYNMEDVIYLKNGGIVRGEIIQNLPNQSLRIKTKDKKVFVIIHDDIEKMTRENIVEEQKTNASNKSPYKKRGLINFTEVNYNIGTGEVKSEYSNINNETRSFGFRSVTGYQFNEYMSLGLGIGIEGLGNETLLSTSIDLRATISEGKVSPVFILNAGTGVDPRDNFGLLIINPQFGIRIYISKNVAYLLNFGYKWQEIERTFNPFPYSITNTYMKEEKVYFKYITISTGFSF
jgi:hypothetical protein